MVGVVRFMPRQFSCVIDGCDFIAEGVTEEDVLEQIQTHVNQEHPNTSEEESMVRENIEQG